MEVESVNFITFSQDYQCILVGNSSGYYFYGIDKDQVFEKESNKITSIMKVCRLYSSSLVVYVSTDDPRKLTLLHHKNNAIIIEIKFSNSILSVKLNRKVVVVCTEDGIYIYDNQNMKRKHKIEVVHVSRNGIFALTLGDNSILAYPSSNVSGNIHVFNIAEMKNVVILEAHQGAIAALEFSQTGDMLATASDKGTVIRIFKIPSGDKYCEFRRGFARCATISCLSFSLDSQFLLACSNTETIHVFSLLQLSNQNSGDKDIRYSSSSSVKDENCSNNPQTKLSTSTSSSQSQSISTAADYSATATKYLNLFGNMFKATTSYLPYPAQHVTEFFYQDRSFCSAHLPFPSESQSNASSTTMLSPKQSMRKVGAVIKYDCGWRIIVGTFDGYIYVFKFDPSLGGEAELVTTYDLKYGKHMMKNVHMTHEKDSNFPLNTSNNSNNSNNRTRSLSIHDPYSSSNNHHLPSLSSSSSKSPTSMLQSNELNITDENEFPPIKK